MVTPASFVKPRFPASVFRRLCKYPRRVCQNPACGRPFAPHLLPDGKLEQLTNFEKRKTCSKACMSVVRNLTKYGTPKPEPRTWPEKLAERQHPPVRAAEVPLAPVPAGKPPARPTDEALRLFQGRYPGMTPHVAWQEHGENATAFWLECLDRAGALAGGDAGKKSGRLEPQPRAGRPTPGGSR